MFWQFVEDDAVRFRATSSRHPSASGLSSRDLGVWHCAKSCSPMGAASCCCSCFCNDACSAPLRAFLRCSCFSVCTTCETIFVGFLVVCGLSVHCCAGAGVGSVLVLFAASVAGLSVRFELFTAESASASCLWIFDEPGLLQVTLSFVFSSFPRSLPDRLNGLATSRGSGVLASGV